MKKILIILILLVSLESKSQSQVDYILGVQSGISLMNTQSYGISLMVGIKDESNSLFLIGPVYKKITHDIGHKQEYKGIRGHIQTTLPLDIAAFLSYEYMKGEYYMYKNKSIRVADIKEKYQGGGTLGVGYMFTERVGLMVGYHFMEYNPREYFINKKSPYKDGSVSVKLSLSLPLAEGFQTSGVGQRRMW